MDGQTPTANDIYNWATSSSDNRLKFLITTHYNQVLARAQGAGLLRGNVGIEALFTAVKAAQVSPMVYTSVLNITPDTSTMTEAAAEAWNRMVPAVSDVSNAPKVQFSQQVPYYCQPGFTGPVPPNATPCPSTSGGGSGWFNSDTVDIIADNIPAVGNAIACWIDPSRCQNNQPPVIINGDGSNGGGNNQPTNYVPWLIGGGVFVVVVAVILIVVLRKK